MGFAGFLNDSYPMKTVTYKLDLVYLLSVIWSVRLFIFKQSI